MIGDRITKRWTETTKQAFGDTPAVQKGIKAEQMFLDWAQKTFHHVRRFEEQYDMQVAGCDFEYQKFEDSTIEHVDVKGNYYTNGTFGVEFTSNGWLFSPRKTSRWICHICESSGQAIYYQRKDMIELINTRWGRYPILFTRGKVAYLKDVGVKFAKIFGVNDATSN